MGFHNKFIGNGLTGINANPLVNSPFVINTNGNFSSDWRRWNGSGNIPFSALGASYYSTFNSISAVKIDSERWLLISGSDSPTVSVGKIVDGVQVYGTPVELDTDINSAAILKGFQIISGKVYINYCWYDGTQNVNYAKICSVDIDDNITFGTRSAQIGAAAPASSSIANALALSAEGHPVHGYYASDTGAYSLVTTTINVDNTITVNTPKSLGVDGFFSALSCQNPTVIFLLLNNTYYAIEITETVIGDTITSVDVYPLIDTDNLSCSIASIGLNQSIVLYQRLSSSDSIVGTSIVTYNSTDQTLSAGAEKTFDDAIYAGELVALGNKLRQVLAVVVIRTPDLAYANAFACCLTPLGTAITDGDLYPINANWYDLDVFISPYQMQSAVLNADIVVAPFVTYNDANYGATILKRANTINPPSEIIHLEADDNLTTTAQPSLGNTVATLGSHILGIISPTDYEPVLLPGTKLLVDGTDIFTVVSANFTGAITNVIVVEATGSYSNVTCSLLGATSWISGVVDFVSSGAEIPSLGEINGQPSLIFYSTNTDAYLESNDFSFPMTLDATAFMVCKTSGTGYVLSSLQSANLTPLADITSQTALVYPANISVGDYDLSPELVLVSLVRTNGNTRIYINGVLNASLTDSYAALAIGNPVKALLGNNFAETNAFIGYLSAYSLWYGALSDSQREAQESYYFEKYSLTPPAFDFSLLSGDRFTLLSGGKFKLLG